MRTKIHWARKSQQPLAMGWTIPRENGKLIILDCTTDKKMVFLLHIKLLLTTDMRATKSQAKSTADRT